MSVEIIAKCRECEEEDDLTNEDTKFICDSCFDQNSSKNFREFIDHIIDEVEIAKIRDVSEFNEHCGIIGFKNEMELI